MESRYRRHLDDLGIKYRTGKVHVSIKTAEGWHRLRLVEFQSARLDNATGAFIAGLLEEDQLLLLNLVSKGLAKRLKREGAQYLDTAGNCHLQLPGVHIHVEGKRLAGASATLVKALRAPSYQALFAYLARPELLNASLRSIAALAGVSTTAVSNIRDRLLRDGYTTKTKSGVRWSPDKKLDVLALWLHGYATSVRPALLYGMYRTPKQAPEVLRAKLLKVLPDLRWGGTTGGYMLNPYYLGPRTTIHVPEPLVLEETKRIPAGHVQQDGNLIVLGTFGTINETDTQAVHPLLVYSEILTEGTDRATDAAKRIQERFL